jgi:tellurite resistance protein TerA
MLTRGQKLRLPDLTTATRLTVGVGLQAPAGVALDISCFGVDAADKLSDDRYFTFYNQKKSPCGSIVIIDAAEDEAQRFSLDLAQLPQAIRKLVFVVTLDGAQDMSCLGESYLRLLDNGREIARFCFSSRDFSKEKAVIVAEIYHKDVWRFAAVGQGFNGGLSALLKHFGGVEKEEVVHPLHLVPPAIIVTPPPKLSLSKITLTNPGQQHRISLEKGASAPQKLIVKAVWTDNGDDCDDNDDLDLRVGILLPDGKMKLVCAPLNVGAFDASPFVRHLGDVTSASTCEPGVEIVEVHPQIGERLGGRVSLVFSVYSALSNGAVSVASLKPIMRMEYGSQVVECAYDFTKSKAANSDTVYTYVIGIAHFQDGTVTLEPSGRTSASGSENTPWLTWGKAGANLSMDGPAVFKDGDSADDFNLGNPRRYW